jgi:hypothetical protein
MRGFLLLGIIPLFAFSKPDVPQAVKATFAKMYPAVKKVHWEKRGDLFEGEYHEGKKEIEAVFSQDGKWLYTLTEVDRHKIPVKVIEGFRKSEFGSWKLDEAGTVIAPDLKDVFFIEAESDKQEYDLFFDQEGTLVRKQLVHTGK